MEMRSCAARSFTKACQLTAVNLTPGNLSNDQLGHITWFVAPQVVAIPFRNVAQVPVQPLAGKVVIDVNNY